MRSGRWRDCSTTATGNNWSDCRRRCDLLAGRKMLLRRCEIGGGVLQRKQILPNSLTQGDIRHGTNTYLGQLTLAGICTLLPLMMRKAIPASFGGASGRLILGRFAGPR